MSEIAIVSAFFDIGRSKWGNYTRDNSTYVNYFNFWARIRNKLIVYTDQDTAKQVLRIRDSYGLKDRTRVEIVDDVISLDPEVYHKMEKVLSNPRVVKMRKLPKNPESYNALYNYVVYLKPYFVADAVKKGYANGMTAWVDFGYNHGGDYYTNPLDFDFLWNYDFSPKIHIFAVDNLDIAPIFEVVRSMKAYFTGSLTVAPAELWKTLAFLYREAALSLATCDMADDDQTLELMAYRQKPEIFDVHPAGNFFTQLKDFGGSHLSTKTIKPRKKVFEL